MPPSNFPQTVTVNGTPVTLRLMTGADRKAILAMAQHLSDTDLAFMRRDITQPQMVDEWIHDVECNRAMTLLAEHQHHIIGYGTLYHNQLFWNRHMGELRILISSPYRNRGMGTRIARELMRFAKELKLDKVIVYMAIEDRSGQHMVEDLGFRPEALLPDWIKTRDDRTHDLLIMSIHLNELHG